MRIEIKVLNKGFYLPKINAGSTTEEQERYGKLPAYATPGSAALDLVCTEDITICPEETKMIHTGLAIWIGSADKEYLFGEPQYAEGISHAGLIIPRSGLGGKRGLVLANLVGLIDADYQGELMVQAWNRLPDIRNCERKKANEIDLKARDRFCQLMFVPVIKAQWEVVEEFSQKTERNIGGFGSTGVNNYEN